MSARYIYTSLPQTAPLRFPIQVSVELIPEPLTRVIKPHLLVQPIDPRHILLLQPEPTTSTTTALRIRLQIRPDPTCGLALRHHRPSLSNPPRQRDLRAVLGVLPPYVRQDLVVDQLPNLGPALGICWVGVPEGRVLRHMNPLVAVELGEGVLREVGVALELVDGGRDGALIEEGAELRGRRSC